MVQRFDPSVFMQKADDGDYIAYEDYEKLVNNYKKLVELAEDLRSGLKYLRDTKTEPYGFGIDRLEEKLQALKAEKQ